MDSTVKKNYLSWIVVSTVIESTTKNPQSKFQNHQSNHQSNPNNPQSKAFTLVGSSPQLLSPQQKTRNQHLKSAIWITQSTIKSIYPSWIVVSTVVVSTTQGSLAVGVHLAITFPGRARIVWAENWKIQVKGWQLYARIVWATNWKIQVKKHNGMTQVISS